MEGFFPERFLGEIFWDELLPSASSESTTVPGIDVPSRIEFEQESFDLGSSSSQNLIEEAPHPPNQSAFIPYSGIPRTGFGHEISQNASNSQNLNNRMIGFLRRGLPGERRNVEEHERDRGFRHMINERMRRKRQRQCCLDLHSMLPDGTKSDNNSVISVAKREIERLRRCREELQRENFKLEGNLQALVEKKRVGGTRIQFPIPNSTSGIDSMLEILNCLKSFSVNIINTNYSSEQLLAVLETETEIPDGEMESIIERKPKEVEWKLQSQLLESSYNEE
ncbi:hypothetical protein L6164_025779 [Bauhinia variegata]|uniref:Uncharacterized protein n=1 Tax=Bauhinia variegata TaxID=167791 RepID=A0ACB9M3E1_BAUVA|nr:hypothetical protein L6164_025779 [Bauhinia variegata]